MNQQRIDWEKIKKAEAWLKANYATISNKEEALERYEALCDSYEKRYGARPFQRSFQAQGSFNFMEAREKLSNKIPALGLDKRSLYE